MKDGGREDQNRVIVYQNQEGCRWGEWQDSADVSQENIPA